jgi:hypothetical protein
MSQLEEAVARLTQARSKLAPIADRISDIETMLAVAAAVDTERPSAKKFSLLKSESTTLAFDRGDRKIWNGLNPPHLAAANGIMTATCLA